MTSPSELPGLTLVTLQFSRCAKYEPGVPKLLSWGTETDARGHYHSSTEGSHTEQTTRRLTIRQNLIAPREPPTPCNLRRLRLDCGDPSVSVGRKRVHNVGCQSVQSLYQPAMRNDLSKSRRGTAAQIARRLYGSTEALSAFKDNWLLETRADSSSLSIWHGRLFSRQPRDPKALLSAGAELYLLTLT